MPPPLYLADDKQLLRTLGEHVLPYLVDVKRVRKQWFVWVDRTWTALRFSSPLLSSFGIGKASEKATVLESLTGPWFIGAICVLLVFAIFWGWIRQVDVPAKALAARRCADGIEAQYDKLYRVLDTPTPDAQVSRMKLDLWELADAARKAKAWPWPPPIPRGDRIKVETAEQIDYIRGRYMDQWTEAAGVDRREQQR